METSITGSITSTQLGNLGKKRYGFIGVKTEDLKEIKIKVAADTKYETLDVGSRVHVVAELIGDMGILTAKSIMFVK